MIGNTEKIYETFNIHFFQITKSEFKGWMTGPQNML